MNTKMNFASKFFYIALFSFAFGGMHLYGQSIPAFPGAEGHGRYVTGGRGGAVYHVTSLEDNVYGTTPASGTLRYGIEKITSARTIVFDVSGTIQLKQQLKIKNDNITIAGQTAPGDGICLAGWPVTINCNNVILRFVRFRMGDRDNINADGADALGTRDYKNIIVDHCSMCWSSDECCSLYGTENLTLQWSIISESMRLSGHTKGAHGYGGIWGGDHASFHHNLMAHHDSRVPRLGPAESTQTKELMDIRNNVYYNWKGNGCYGAEGMKANIVNNYYKPGPATANASSLVKQRIVAIDIRTEAYVASYPAFAPMVNVWGKFFIDGNVMEGNANVTNDNWTNGVYAQISSSYGISQTTKDTIRLSDPLPTGVITTHTAQKAYDQVLLYAGCSLFRDDIDKRIISETQNKTFSFTGSKSGVSYPGIIDTQDDTKPVGAAADWSPWPALTQKTAPTDTDGDGMPDTWETAHGLNPALATDRNDKNVDPKGEYTNLEVYINSLVEDITNNQNNGGTLISSIQSETTQGNGLRISAYPNPVQDHLTISSNSELNKAELLSMTGSVIKVFSLQGIHENLNLSSLNKGVYVLRVLDKKGNNQSFKILK
jgi:Pectate lyase.